jgi:hypothetical protein
MPVLAIKNIQLIAGGPHRKVNKNSDSRREREMAQEKTNKNTP